MVQQPKKQQSKVLSDDTLIEQLRDVGRGVTSTVTHDLISGVASDALTSLLSGSRKGTLKPGEAVEFPDKQVEMPPAPPEMNWPFRRERKPTFAPQFSQETLNRLRDEEREVARKIEEIRLELKALVATIASVDQEIGHAVSGEFIDPGIYHLNFLDRLKTMLTLIRKNLADSASWLSVMRSRKKERKYWNMYKHKGTTFGLSHERVVATQVG